MATEFYQLTANNPRDNPSAWTNLKEALLTSHCTKCGLAPQFEGLEQLYQQYKEQGLVVLVFPVTSSHNRNPYPTKAWSRPAK